MSSSSNHISLSQTLSLFQELPFFQVSIPFITHISLESAYRQISVHNPLVLTNNSARYREENRSPLTDNTGSQDSELSLSPTINLTHSHQELELISSFEQLTIDSDHRRRLFLRIQELRSELSDWTNNLEAERSQAIFIVNSVTTVAITSVRNRIQPQIDCLQELLRRDV